MRFPTNDDDDDLTAADKIFGYKAPAKRDKRQSRYDDLFEASGSRHGVDPDLLRAMTRQESTFKPDAVSPKGASGLMQLMPATAKRFGVSDIHDPQQNIEGGTKYMRWLLDRFGGDVDKALAGYNAGEGAVDKYKGIPPYSETQNYVRKIRGNYTGSGYYGKKTNGKTDIANADAILGYDANLDKGIADADKLFGAADSSLADADAVFGIANNDTSANPKPARRFLKPGDPLGQDEPPSQPTPLNPSQILFQTGIKDTPEYKQPIPPEPSIPPANPAQPIRATAEEPVTLPDARSELEAAQTGKEPVDVLLGGYRNRQQQAAPPQRRRMQSAGQPADRPLPQATDADFQSANEYLASTGQPALTREQFDAAQKANGRDVEVSADPSTFQAGGQNISSYEREMPTPDGGTVSFAREAGNPSDAPNGRVGTYRAPAGMSPEDAAYNAVLNVGSRYQNFTPQMARDFVARLKKQGSSLILGKYDPKTGGTVVVDWQTLANAGLDTQFARRSEQAQSRLSPEVSNTRPESMQEPESILNRFRGITPQQERQETLEADPLYREARQNLASDSGATDQDILAEYARLQSNANIARQREVDYGTQQGQAYANTGSRWAEGLSKSGLVGADNALAYKLAGLAGETYGTAASALVGSGGRGVSAIAGTVDLIRSVNPLWDRVGAGKLAETLRNTGLAMQNAEHTEATSSNRKGVYSSVVRTAASLPGDISRLLILSRLPGGSVVTFGADAGLQSLGASGNLDGQVFKDTLKGVGIGLLFHGANAYVQPTVEKAIAARLGLSLETQQLIERGALNSPYKGTEKAADAALSVARRAFISKLSGEGAKLGVIGAGVYTQAKLEGSEHPGRDAVLMMLTDLAMNARKVSDIGKLSRQIWRVGDGASADGSTGKYKDVLLLTEGGDRLAVYDVTGKVPNDSPVGVITAEPVFGDVDLSNIDRSALKPREHPFGQVVSPMPPSSEEGNLTSTDAPVTGNAPKTKKWGQGLTDEEIANIQAEAIAAVAAEKKKDNGSVPTKAEAKKSEADVEVPQTAEPESATRQTEDEAVAEQQQEKPVSAVRTRAKEMAKGLFNAKSKDAAPIQQDKPSDTIKVDEQPTPKQRRTRTADVRANDGEPASGIELPKPRKAKGRVVRGKTTSVRIPDSTKSYDGEYEVRELGDVIPSHNPVTFQPNPEYPFRNDRRYEAEQQYQEQVRSRSQGQNFDASQLVNNAPTADVGVPIIDVDGHVLGGNSRSMMLHRIYEGAADTAARDNYKKELLNSASVFGIDPKKVNAMDKPVLVRKLTDESIDRQEAITNLNKPSTTSLTTAERQQAEASRMSDEAVDHISGFLERAGDDATLNAALDDFGVPIINKLIEEGVFTGGERNVLLKDGKITQDGKTRIGRLLAGRVFDDLEQYEFAPPYLKRNIERAVSPLIKTQSDKEWNIIPEVREAIDLLTEYKAKGGKQTLRQYAETPSFVRPAWSDAAIDIAGVLQQSPNAVSKAFKTYANEYANTKSGGGLFGAATQEQAFDGAFVDTMESVEDDSGNVSLFQKAPIPNALGFYSQVEKVIADKMPNKASAEQVKGILDPKNGVKKEELEWLDIDSFLDGKKSVTKGDLLDYIRANNVQVEEVVKSDDNQNSADIRQRKIDLWDERDALTLDDDNYDSRETQTRLAEINRELNELSNKPIGDATKFSQYALPGGENYRELLLTMPEKPSVQRSLTWNRDASGNLDTKDNKGVVWEILPRGRNFLLVRNGEQGNAYPSEAEAKLVVEKQAYLQSDGGNYRSSHFSEPNILAHVRFDERDGGKTLHIAEIQSDWHQAGRKKGYAISENADVPLKAVSIEDGDQRGRGFAVSTEGGRFITNVIRPEGGLTEDAAIAEARRRISENPEQTARHDNRVSDAPFKRSWQEFAFKRMLRYAAENGYDRITWDTGETQADRYDLSKSIERVTYWKNADGTYGLYAYALKGGEKVIGEQSVPESKLEEYVGKDLAQKIADTAPTDGDKTLSGLDLKTPAPGMAGFYDKILPSFVNKYTKKWGGKVEGGQIVTGERLVAGYITEEPELYEMKTTPDTPFAVFDPRLGDDVFFKTKTEAEQYIKDWQKDTTSTTPVHSLTITSAMRESVMQGQPLFKKAGLGDKEYLTGVLPFAHTEDLLSEATGGKFVDGNIELNEADGELLRRIQSTFTGSHVTAFYGATHTAQGLKNLAKQALKDVAAYSNLGYTDAQIKPLRDLAKNLETLAGSGEAGITYVYDDSLPEETHHKLVLDAGGISQNAINKLKASPLWNASDQFALEYKGINDRSKAIELAAKLETDQPYFDKGDDFENLKKEFLNIIADDIIDRNTVNGVFTLDPIKFERITNYAKDQTGNETGRTEKQGSPGSQRPAQTQSEGEGFSPQGKEKRSKTPESLREKAIPEGNNNVERLSKAEHSKLVNKLQTAIPNANVLVTPIELMPEDAKRQVEAALALLTGQGRTDVGDVQFAKGLGRDVRVFSEYVDRVLQGQSNGKAGQVLSFTPDVYQRLKAKNLKIAMRQIAAEKILRDKHGIAEDVLKQIPNEILSPVAVINYKDANTGAQGFRIFTTLKDNTGNPIVIGLSHNLRRGTHELHLVPTVFGYERLNVKPQDIRYVNEERLAGLPVLSQLASAYREAAQANNSTILTEKDFVNSGLDGVESGVELMLLKDVQDALGKAKDASELHQTIQNGLLGATFPDGTIWLNENTLNAETPIHEFGHLWAKIFPEKWAKGMDMIRSSPAGRNLMNGLRDRYGNDEQTLANEALAHAVGQQGKGIFTGSRLQRFMAWLKDLYAGIAKKLGIFRTIGERLEKEFKTRGKGAGLDTDQSVIDAYARGIARELLGGRKLRPEGSAAKGEGRQQAGVQFSVNREKAEITPEQIQDTAADVQKRLQSAGYDARLSRANTTNTRYVTVFEGAESHPIKIRISDHAEGYLRSNPLNYQGGEDVSNVVRDLKAYKAQAQRQDAEFRAKQAARQEELAARKQRDAEFRAKQKPTILRSVPDRGNAQASPIGFYSRTEKTLLDKMPEKASREQVLGLLNPQKGSGIKEIDPEYQALKLWLDDQKGTLTKTDVLDFVRANKVEVENVELGKTVTQDIDVRETQVRVGGSSEWGKGWGIYANGRQVTFVSQDRYPTKDDAIDYARRNGLISQKDVSVPNPAKFDTPQLKLPGESTNYREEFLTAPEQRTTEYNVSGKKHNSNAHRKFESLAEAKNYREELESEGYTTRIYDTEKALATWEDGHWQYSGVQNPIVRVRYDDRETADGSTMLFNEEVQQPSKENLAKMPKVYQKYGEEMGWRRMVYKAVNEGYDYLGFTTGEQQADRYNLARAVEKIESRRAPNDASIKAITITPKGTNEIPGVDIHLYVNEQGRVVEGHPEYIGKNLADNIVGKDIAKQILESTEPLTIEGEGLKIGGQALANRYDKNAVAYLNKFLKPYGGKVEMVDLKGTESNDAAVWTDARIEPELIGDTPTGEYEVFATKRETGEEVSLGVFSSKAEAERIAAEDTGTASRTEVHAVKITPEMRKAFGDGKGVPLLHVPRTPENVGTLHDLTDIDDFTDIIPKIDTSVSDNTVTLGTPETAEVVRTLLASVANTKRNKQPILGGLFLSPATVTDLIDAVDGMADAAQEAGVAATTIDKLKTDLAEARDASSHGGIKLKYFDEAMPHEDIHEGSYIGADGKMYERRYANAEELKSDPIFTKFHKALVRVQGEASHGVAMEEALAYLGTGEHSRFGLTKAEADGILAKLVEGYAEANGVDSLAHFKPGTKLYERIDAFRKGQSSEGSDVSRGGLDSERQARSDTSAEEPSSTDIAEDSRARGSGEGSTPERTGTPEREVGQKKAAFSRILGQDYFRDSQSHEETEERAAQLVGNIGTADAVSQALYGKPSAEAMRVVHWELARLNGLADAYMRSGEVEKFNAAASEVADLSARLIQRQVSTGQEVEIAKMLEPLSPEVAMLTATKMVRFSRGDDAQLTPKQVETVIQIANELRDANAELAKASEDLENALRDVNADLDKAHRKITRLEKDREQSTRTSTQTGLLKKYKAKEPEILAKLQQAFPNSPMFSGKAEALRTVPNRTRSDDGRFAESEILRSTPNKPLDRETRDLLTEYTVGQILLGKTYQNVIATLGDISGADANEIKGIHAAAVDVIRAVRDTRTEDAKAKARIRNHHYQEADNFSNAEKVPRLRAKPGLSSIAQDAYDLYPDDPDLILAINRLTGSRPKSINDVIGDIRNELRKSMPESVAIVRRADAVIRDIRAERAKKAAEAKKLTPELIKSKNEARVRKAHATYRLTKFLSQLAENPNLVQRFNNDFRAKIVSNWGTQIFNAIQATTVAAPSEIMLDLFETGLKSVGLRIGETPDINAKDILLPYKYILGNNRQLAEFALSEFPEEYFKVHSGLLGDIEIEPMKLAPEKTGLSKPLHWWFDKNQVLNEKLAHISGAKLQEMHFRNAIVGATLDQLVRRKSNGAVNLRQAIETNTLRDYITEADAKSAADKALRVTFAASIDDKLGKTLKHMYDKLDKVLPVLLNPVTFARFTYTTTRTMVANPILLGALDSTALGGQGYNTRSLAKGVLAWAGIATAYGLLSLLGGDDDKWYTLFVFGKDEPPIDIRRFFPLSAYFYIADVIRGQAEGRPLPKAGDVIEAVASLETDYFRYGAAVELASTLAGKAGGTKDWSDVGGSSARAVGSYLAGILRFAKPMRDTLAQFDSEEAKMKNYSDSASDKFLQEMAKTLPLVSRASNAATKQDVDGNDVLTPFPLGRMFGVSLVHPTFLTPKETVATEWAKRLFPNEYTGGEFTADERKAYQARKMLKNAVRGGKDVDYKTKINELVANKTITPRSATLLRKDLEMSELQSLIKMRFSVNDKDIEALRKVWAKATDEEREAIRQVLQTKNNRTNELDMEFGLKPHRKSKKKDPED